MRSLAWIAALLLLASGLSYAGSPCPDAEVLPYDPAEPPAVPGLWLSDEAGRCLLAEVEVCRQSLTLEERLSAELRATIQRQADRIVEASTGRWWEDPRIWFGAGVIAGGVAVVLGGWAVAGVAR